MKKALVITSVASMVDQFLIPGIKLLQEMGYEVHAACNFEQGSTCSDERIAELKKILEDINVSYYQIDFARNVTKIADNMRAYKQVKKLVDANEYEIVHCHSPIGGLMTRLACRKLRKKGTRVFYTAHGFHFYKGAPTKNWAIYYPIERVCARFTDVLITINKEDYELAKKKFKAKRVEYVPGVGIDVKKFAECKVDVFSKRSELGIPNDAFLLFSVGELNQNKNHQSVIKAMAEAKNEKLHYMVAGRGNLKEDLLKLAKELGLEGRVHLLEYRKDVRELYKTANVYLHPSYREGLPVAVVEALAAGSPIICTNIRGNSDVVKDGVNGILVGANDVEAIKNAILKMVEAQGEIGKTNSEDAMVFDVASINDMLQKIYLQ